VQNSLIEDGSCGVTSGVNGNLTGDPALNGDLTLSSLSKAINAGSNALIPSGITTDLAGNARIQFVTVDIGAYESAFSVVGPTATPTATSTPSSTPTATPTPVATQAPTPTPSGTPTPTSIATPTPSRTPTPTPVATHTPAPTPSSIATSTPLQPPTPTPNGFVPPDANTASCEVAIARGLLRLSDCTRKCNTMQASFALQGVPFDDDACEDVGPTSCRGSFDADSAAAPACPACLDGAAQADVADQVMDFIAQTNGAVYCRGRKPFGGGDTGFVPRNASVASCEGAVATALRKYATCIVRCDIRQARALANGGSFDANACKFTEPASCRAVYDARSASVLLSGGCPTCLDAIAQTAAADDVTDFVAELRSSTYCAGTVPLP